MAAVILISLMSFTGPRPETESSGVITRTGGVCLQLERWGLFGWVIGGQTYSESDITSGNWHRPPSSSPPCEETPEAEHEISLPPDAASDVYRLCGLADERGCLEFILTPEAAPEP